MTQKKQINLALQGGGAHGAFTWGVLDRLLQEPEIEISGMSGTSAGALNGAAVKAGLTNGGPEAARAQLDWLWNEIAGMQDHGLMDMMRPWAPPTAALSHMIEYSPGFMAADMISRMTSPYVASALVPNPLTPIVEKLFCAALCDEDDGPDFSICATNVRTGKIKIFRGESLSVDAILASACLPTLFKAVEITDPKTGKKDAYWDGGYTGNPALFPLFEAHLPSDIVIININPLHRENLPVSPQQIQNRINEISFNSSLFRELRAIHFVKRLLRDGSLTPGTMKNVMVHMIADDVLMNDLSVATKMVATPMVIHDLHKAGMLAADKFLQSDVDNIGKKDSVDLEAMFA